MEMTMNKHKFIEELFLQLGYSQDTCNMINDILEKNFFISKKNKDKIIMDLKDALDIKEEEAKHIYHVAIKIIEEEIKRKLKHPFQNQDKDN